MKLRFASPELLVDINNLPGLDHHVQDPDGSIRIGALCRHADLERSALLPAKQPTMAAAAPLIADPIVRNRGTLVGSLCHADPQGDWASVVTALGGHVVAQGAGGRRTIKITDFVTGPFQNVLDYDEIAVEAVIPAAQGTLAGGYLKLERRVGDFATAGVAVSVDLVGGRVARAGIGLTGVGSSTIDAREAADALVGRSLDEAGIEPRRRPRGRGRAAEDRPPRQRRLQAAHRAHLRHPDPDPGRRRTGEGSMTSLFDEITAAAPDDAVPVRRVTITVNGERRTADIEPRLLLAHLLRQGLRLTGTHTGCDTTNCGACTVLVDGTPGEELHDARRPGRRPRGHHRRGARYGRASWTRCRRGSRRSTASSAASARRG